MDLISINLGLSEVVENSPAIYNEYFKYKTEFENLDEQKKVMFATISMKYDGSENRIERLARADEDWKAYVSGLNEARKNMNKALSRVKSMEVRLSCYQSLAKTYLTEPSNNAN